MQVYNNQNENRNNAEEISKLYEGAKNIHLEIAKEVKEAKQESIAAQEAASKSRIDIFSNEKARQMNSQYGEYMEGAIRENFDKQIDLNNQSLSLEEQKLQIKLMRMEQETEMRIQKREFEAELELKRKEAEGKKRVQSKFHYWAWRLFWPICGIAAGVGSFYLLYQL